MIANALRLPSSDQLTALDPLTMRLLLISTLATLVSVLLVTAASAPVPSGLDEEGLRALTSKDFKTNTATGMWFVEFFSPSCHRASDSVLRSARFKDLVKLTFRRDGLCTDCQAFMPTWKDLSEISAHLEDSSALYMARVDCTLQGDVCAQENIQAVPSMHLYEDGKLSTQYEGSRTFPVLKAWIFNRAEDFRRHKGSDSNAVSS